MYAILAIDTLFDTKCKITMLSHSTNDSIVLFQHSIGSESIQPICNGNCIYASIVWEIS